MNHIIGAIAEIVLWADDLEPMVKFYRDVLGFQQLSPPEQKSPIYLQACLLMLEQAPVPQMVVLQQKSDDGSTPQPSPRQQFTFALHHDSIYKQLQVFHANGMVVRDNQPHPVYVGRTFIVDDPVGNEVKFVGLTGPGVFEIHEDGTETTSPMKAQTP